MDKLPPLFRELIGNTDAPAVQTIFNGEAGQLPNGRIVLEGGAACSRRPHCALGKAKSSHDAMKLASAIGIEKDEHWVEDLQAWNDAQLRSGNLRIEGCKTEGRALQKWKI